MMGALELMLLLVVGIEECRHDDGSIDWDRNEAELCSEVTIGLIGRLNQGMATSTGMVRFKATK